MTDKSGQGGSVLVGQGKSVTVTIVSACAIVVLALMVILTIETNRLRRDMAVNSATDHDASEQPVTGVEADDAASGDRSVATKARGNPARFFGPENYPAAALRAGEEGRVEMRLSIDRAGRVTDCAIVNSSGSDALDSATCHIARTKIRFTPARDTQGKPIASHYPMNVAWKLQD